MRLPTNSFESENVPMDESLHHHCDDYDCNSSDSTLKKKILIKISKYNLVLLFLFVYHCDFIFMQFVFPDYFDSKNDQKAYRGTSLILYAITTFCYLNCLLGKPTQTNMKEMKEKYPSRIFSDKFMSRFPKNCEQCDNAPKFDRTSHCSQCKICILKRDHHCPWVNKCIGHQNMRYFMGYLIWLEIFGIHYFRGLLIYYNNSKGSSLILKVFIILCSLFTIGVAFSISNLAFQKIFEFFNDQPYYETTKNFTEKYIPCINRSENVDNGYNQYNKGWLFNLEVCFGPTIFHWFFPIPLQYKHDIEEYGLDELELILKNRFVIISLNERVYYYLKDKFLIY